MCDLKLQLPCRECIALLQELDAPVEFIVLPTFAYEHKVFVAPFSRKFPSARVFTAPSCAPLPAARAQACWRLPQSC